MYLSDDFREAILFEGRHKLFYCTDLTNLTYKELHKSFASIRTKVNDNAYWDFAIPWFSGELIGCYEFYNLITVNPESNELLDEIPYYPGISITKCSFNDSVIDEPVENIIQTNNK